MVGLFLAVKEIKASSTAAFVGVYAKTNDRLTHTATLKASPLQLARSGSVQRCLPDELVVMSV